MKQNCIVKLDAELQIIEHQANELNIQNDELTNKCESIDEACQLGELKKMDMYDNIMSIKKMQNKIKKDIDHTDKKRYDERLFKEECQQKMTFHEIEHKRYEDKLSVETCNEIECIKEFQKQDEQRIELSNETRDLRDSLNNMVIYNSALISQLEMFQRENEEIKDILNRDRLYHEMKRNVGDSMKLARELLFKNTII